MPLSDLKIRTAKLTEKPYKLTDGGGLYLLIQPTTEKPYKLTDGGGLYLLIQPTGARLWRLNYHYQEVIAKL